MSRSEQFVGLLAGLRPPQIVIERLERFHPNVKLVWNNYFQRWALMEMGLVSGKMEPIFVLHGPHGEYVHPTIFNTVYRLNDMDVRTLGYWDRKKWLDQLDHGHEEAQEAERRAVVADISRDMLDRVWHDRGKRTGVLVNGCATDKQEARRTDSAAD